LIDDFPKLLRVTFIKKQIIALLSTITVVYAITANDFINQYEEMKKDK